MKDILGTTAILAVLTMAHLYGCDDGSREPRPFVEPATVGGGGGYVDPCDPLPETCEVGDSCGCWGGEPGERPFRGSTFCDVDGRWTSCEVTP